MADKGDLIKAAPSDNPYAEAGLNFTESTKRDSYLYPDSQLSPWNPDDLVQQDQDYSLYTEMTRDDQVSVCLQIKKDLILSSGFDFIAKEDGHEDIVDDLRIAINEDPEWPFEEMLEEMISAYEYGFSCSEKVFQKREDGKLSIKFIKTRFPGSWLFHTDEYGNVIKYEQQGVKGNTEVKKEALIHYINKRKFQNPYGESDLRPAYQAWFQKKHITRWYGIFIEKAASPIPVAKYDKAIDEDTKERIHNAIKKFQTKTALTIPKHIEIEFLEAKSNGEAFTKGIDIFNMFIGRSLMIPDLLGFQGGETAGGAYALGKMQMEVFFKHIRRRRELLEKVVNTEIVWPIVLYNFGFVDNYPKFKFNELSKEDTIEMVKLWLDAVKSRVYSPSDAEIEHFRNIVNFPSTDEAEIPEEELLVPEEEPEDDEEENRDKESPNSENRDNEEPDVNVFPTKDGGPRFAQERKYPPTSGTYADRTDFDLVEKQLDTSLNAFLAISQQTVDAIFKQFIEEIDRKKIVQRAKTDKLDSLALKNLGGLKQKLSKALLELFKNSGELAASEVFKHKFAKPIVSEDFLEILESENFNFIKDWEYNVTKTARLAIIEAIKDGKSIAQVVDIVDKDAKAAALASLERYARTKFTEVMNKGRLNFFEKSGVVAGYQYSAVLDDRTTECCRGLHGKIFKSGDQPIPPMHFNCRSVLVPITVYESFEPDTTVGKTPINDFIEEKKGAGFPKQ